MIYLMTSSKIEIAIGIVTNYDLVLLAERVKTESKDTGEVVSWVFRG